MMKLLRLVPFAFLLVVGVGCKDKGQGEGDSPATGTKPVAGEPGAASGSGTATGTAVTTTTDATPDQKKLLADLASVQDAVCACKDRPCVEQAVAAGAAFDDRLNTMYEDEAKLSTAVKTRVDAIQHGIEACTTRIGGANAPLSAAVLAVLAEFDALQVEICKCADHACADTAIAKGAALQTKLKDTFNAAGDIPEEALSRMQKVEDATKACVAKLSR